MTSRVYHRYQQDLSQLRSALPILPSTQRPDFQLIFKRLLSKSACLRGSAPHPAAAGALQRPQTPSWKRLVLTTLLKNRSRATAYNPFCKQFPRVHYLVWWVSVIKGFRLRLVLGVRDTFLVIGLGLVLGLVIC